MLSFRGFGFWIVLAESRLEGRGRCYNPRQRCKQNWRGRCHRSRVPGNPGLDALRPFSPISQDLLLHAERRCRQTTQAIPHCPRKLGIAKRRSGLTLSFLNKDPEDLVVHKPRIPTCRRADQRPASLKQTENRRSLMRQCKI